MLELSEIPFLFDAALMGWECKMWGQYRALVKAEDGAVVDGVM